MQCIRCNKEFKENIHSGIYCQECMDSINNLLGLVECEGCFNSVPASILVNNKCPVCNLDPHAPQSWIDTAMEQIDVALAQNTDRQTYDGVIHNLYNDTQKFIAKYFNACAGDCINCANQLCVDPGNQL